MVFANMLNVQSHVGCAHASPATVLHPRSATHCHRRPTTSLRVQATAETETQAPATSNGSTPKVRSVDSVSSLGTQVGKLSLYGLAAERSTSWHSRRRDIGGCPLTPLEASSVIASLHRTSLCSKDRSIFARFHGTQLKCTKRDCLYMCRISLPDQEGTGGAQPYVMPFLRPTCRQPTSSCQFLCMMGRRTVLLHPCQGLTAWAGGMGSLMRFRKLDPMASTKLSYSQRSASADIPLMLCSAHLHSLFIDKNAQKGEHR